ncbi:MAG: DUF3617 domain-containing protein [Acidobacteriota bacterium]|nr:DUF3617 domain-containing protein [Acidobacteriota bacterium]
MNLLSTLLFSKPRQVSGLVLVLMCAATGLGQVGAAPIKPGLWETQVTSTNVMSMPPEMESRMAAMPPEQQAMMRSRMGGAPVTTTHKGCMASQASMDSMLNDAQQKAGLKCTFSNRQETGSTLSFDTACTMQQTTMKGHSTFHVVDADHATGTTHMEGTMTTPRGSTTMKFDSKMSSKYLGADCGDVKPYSAGAAQGK